MRWIATALAALVLGAASFACAPAASAAAATPHLRAASVLVLDHGRTVRHIDRFDEAALEPDPSLRPTLSPRAAHAGRLTFAVGLDRLLAAGSIDQATHDADSEVLRAARRSFGRIGGTRRSELGAVLANLDEIAAAGELTASRLPELVLTLKRNRDWWTTGPLLSAQERVGFQGSQLVWEYYPGQGIQIQWLGTFGKANGYFLAGHTNDTALRSLLDEAIGLAAQRAGGIAWEYDFHFDGGAPPWVSALAEGTGVQTLGRAAVRFGRGDYFTAASAGLGIFGADAPVGIRETTPAGARYLIYSFAPGEHVLNAFIQALVGLFDYAGLANNDTARALFSAGAAQARLDVPGYDTGAWSLYDQTTESDLSYHVLLRDFLQHLCERLQAPATVAQNVVVQQQQQPGPTGGTPAGPPPVPAPPPPPPPPPPDATIYCTTAAHFTAYIHQPPVLALTPLGPARAGRTARVRLRLSKISTITLRQSHAGRSTVVVRAELGHGVRTLDWRPPAAGGYRLSVTATDLAGNAASSAPLAVTASAPARHG